jgi:hypothetical protein
MDEAGARALLERLARTEAPPSRVDVGLARRRGRRKLRWRRACVPGAAALAAVAVIALVTGGAISFGTGSPGPGRLGPGRAAGSAAPLQPAPRQFSPLIPYAAFGWLPAGYSFLTGGTSPTADYLTAGPKPTTQYAELALNVYSGNICNLAGGRLYCGGSSGSTVEPVTGQAPPVNGRHAFWAGGYLAWQYARGGWATVSGMPDRQALVKIARTVRFGAGAMPSIAFPVQLTGALSTWRLDSADGSVAFTPYRGVLRASQWYLSHGSARAMISVYVDPAPPSGACPAADRTVGGYRVSISHIQAVRGNPPGQNLCAADADGLSVNIVLRGRGTPNVISVFAQDTRPLGPNPANWTTRPLG